MGGIARSRKISWDFAFAGRARPCDCGARPGNTASRTATRTEAAWRHGNRGGWIDRFGTNTAKGGAGPREPGRCASSSSRLAPADHHAARAGRGQGARHGQRAAPSGSYQLLHQFASDNAGGDYPQAHLVLDGGVLYRATTGGGDTDAGTVFSVNVDGSNFRVLHSFGTNAADGSVPYAGLTLVGSTLFGATRGGGHGEGTIFSINTDGSNYQVLHTFTGGASDGDRPDADLTLVGTTLFGTTVYGGHGLGTVFSMNTDGSNFQVVFSFTGPDGAYPEAGLTLAGTTLYGTTAYGGQYSQGTVFSLDTDGTNFQDLYGFSGLSGDGANPYPPVTLVGTTLYGTTIQGGASNLGTIYSLGADGSNFAVLHSFAGGTLDGETPYAGLTLVGSSLFGTTFQGGSVHNDGVVFSIDLDGSNYRQVQTFDHDHGAYPYAQVVTDGASLYGVTYFDGYFGLGEVYSLSLDGTNFQVLHRFNSGNAAGAAPQTSLAADGSVLYGTAAVGGVGNYGTLYAINSDGSGFTPLHTFTGTMAARRMDR